VPSANIVSSSRITTPFFTRPGISMGSLSSVLPLQSRHASARKGTGQRLPGAVRFPRHRNHRGRDAGGLSASHENPGCEMSVRAKSA
jgi:hypothetical protein